MITRISLSQKPYPLQMNLFGAALMVAAICQAGACSPSRSIRSERASTADAPADLERLIAEHKSQLRLRDEWEQSLINDKADLLTRLGAAEAERDSLKLQANLTESILDSHKFSILDRNNPLEGVDVRATCALSSSVDLNEFLGRASALVNGHPEIRGIPEGTSPAVLSMLVVAGLLDFGHAVPHDGTPGCISDSVRAAAGEHKAVRFEDYRQARHGCCIDFAVLLLELLRYQKIACGLRMSLGHIVVEVLPGGGESRTSSHIGDTPYRAHG